MQTQSYEFYNALLKTNDVYLISWGRQQKYLPFFLIEALFKSVYFNLKHKVDVIQLGDLVLSPLGLLLKLVFNKTTFAMAHGKDTSFSNILYRLIVFRSVKKLDGIVCVSQFLKNRLTLIGVQADRLFVNPNGINCSVYENRFDKKDCIKRVESEYGVTLKGKKILLSVSRLVKKKGIANFVRNIFPDIVKQYSQILLLIVGQEYSREALNERDDIIETADRLGLRENILLTGNVEDRQGLLKQIYTASDIFVMPNRHNKEDFEGFGIVALEASLNGVPVVAFGADGITDAVKDSLNGILVKEDDSEEFTQAVVGLLQDENKRESLGLKARMFVKENYNWDVITHRYNVIIREQRAHKQGVS